MPDTVRYPYLGVRNPIGNMQIRPMLPIALIFNDKPLLSNAHLDTGADVNVLPYTMGIQLGAS